MGWILIFAVIMFGPGIAAGLLVGLSVQCLRPAMIGAVGGAILGTIAGLFLGWALIPFSLEGGPHGGALAGHIVKSLIAAVGGSLLGGFSGAGIAVKSNRRAERRRKHRKK